MWSFKENENLHFYKLWLLHFTFIYLGHHGCVPITTSVQILIDCHVPLKNYKSMTLVDLQIYSIDAWQLARRHMMAVNKVCVVEWVGVIGWEKQPQLISLSFPHCVSYIKVGIRAFSMWSLVLLGGDLCLNGIWQDLYLWGTPQHYKHMSHGPLTFTDETMS